MTNSAATTIRQRLDALKPQVLAIASRHGASNLRIYGSISTGYEHAGSELDLLVDLPEEQSLLGLISLRQGLEDAEDTAEAEAILRAHEPRVSWEELKTG
jgi:predicted nucleotidyltransferase